MNINDAKNKLVDSMGIFGVILFYALTFIALFAPLSTLRLHWLALYAIIAAALAMPVIYTVASPFLYAWAIYRIATGQCHVKFLFWIGFAAWIIVTVVPFVVRSAAIVIDHVSAAHPRQK